ncbi:trans-sulfuration enzyme family protein [Actinospongicola halichondriae]|uniref:trans-sulfuration enzyme family protein n=1 Tax=Actinospongicola halichondriae TaxID=3236844 RepID=UPI003D5825B3
MSDESVLRAETRAIRAGRGANHGSIATPIWPSSAYELRDLDASASMASQSLSTEFYARNGTPTAQAFADAVADLEGAEAGIAFGSGMGAAASVILGMCSNGDRVVAQASMFSVTTQLLSRMCPRFGIDVEFVDAFDADAVAAAVAAKPTQLVWVETPANPMMSIVDLEAIGAIKGPFTAVDSTMATPAVQNPHDFGIDFVVHSATKGIAGHNDALLGAVTGERELIDVIWGHHVMHGAVASPFDAFLGLRGIRTLHAWMRQQTETAQALAERLEALDGVTTVRYPGLPSNDGHELAMRQMRNGGAVVVADLAGGYDAGVAMVEKLELAIPAVSFGGTETLVTHAASMSAATLAPQEREAMGISDGLIRISVGLEHVDDVIGDLVRAIG